MKITRKSSDQVKRSLPRLNKRHAPGHHREEARRFPVVSLVLGLAVLAIWLFPAASAVLELDRQALTGGQLWRVMTCHFTHWSADHLAWDLTAFVILGALCEVRDRRGMLGVLLVSAVMISLGTWVFLPHLNAYRGLSGLDSALFGLAAVFLVHERLHVRDFRGLVLLALVLGAFAAKVAYEIGYGGTVFVDSTEATMVPVPLAHVVGCAVGCMAALWRIHWRSRRVSFMRERKNN
ncbi:MAG: rhombosortase [Candidatus Pacebacteria bacterium]|nr:rhombosortase [Candidatus Paceibacterota bacterium]